MATVSIVRDQYDGSATIASGASTSDAIDMQNRAIVGFYFPTLTAGVVGFQARQTTSDTWVTVQKTDGSAAFTLASGTGLVFISVHDVLCGARFCRVATSVTQGGARTIDYTLKG